MERRGMNLNEFAVLPNGKAKSVKLNARDLGKMQKETVTLAKESKEMEERLQQLKEKMSKEKEERSHSGRFRWRSGQHGSFNSTLNSTNKSRENTLQKLSAGKVKVRVLKDNPLTVPPKPLPPPPQPIINQMPRKIRLRGTNCGQCQTKAAGLTDLQARMHSLCPPSIFASPCHSPPSVPSRHHIKPIEMTRQRDQRTNKVTETVAKPMQLQPHLSQVLALNQEEKKVEMIEEELKRPDKKGFPNTLLTGEYDEEESARVFQEALRQWRREKSDGLGEPLNKDATRKSVQPVSVLATATQVDLAPDRRLEGPGRAQRKTGVPVRVEFTQNRLTYMDRLFLKKHRRTPFETNHQWSDYSPDLNLLPNVNTEVKAASSQMAQEEALHSHCVSLFSVPVRTDGAQPQTTAPKSYLTIEFLDESSEDTDGDFVAEQKTDKDSKHRKVSTVQRVLSKEGTQLPQTALTRDTWQSSRASCSSPDATYKSINADEPVPNLHLSEPQVFQAQHSETSSFYNSIQPACPTSDSPRISKTSINESPSTSQKPNCTPTVHKSKLDDGSSRRLHYSSLPHTPLVSARSPVPKDFLSHPPPSMSSSLRSTFTFSPLGSNELTLLPQVYQSTSFQKRSNSSLLSEQPGFSQSLPETILSLEPSQSPASNLESTKESQRSLCHPDSLLVMNQPQLLLSSVSSSPNPPSESLGPSPLVKALSSLSLCNESLPDVYCRNTSDPTNVDAASLPLNIIQNTLAINLEEEGEDSEDEMSIDSLDVIPFEEDWPDEEEEKLYTGVTRVRSGEELQRNQPTHVERENDLQTEEEEQLSKTPDGIVLDPIHDSDTREHTLCDSKYTSQSAYDSGPTVSETSWPRSSLSNYTDEHMVFRMMDNHKQHYAFQLHSPTTAGREISVNQLGMNAGCHLFAKSTPVVSQVTAASYLSTPMLRSELKPALRVSSQTALETNLQVCFGDAHLDTDTTSQTLHELGQEFRLMTQVNDIAEGRNVRLILQPATRG